MPEVARFSSALPPIGCRATENNLNSIKKYALSLSPFFLFSISFSLSLSLSLSLFLLEQITSQIISSRGEDEVRRSIGTKFLLLFYCCIVTKENILEKEKTFLENILQI